MDAACPAVDRDPAYATWEDERTALVLRQTELTTQISNTTPLDDEAIYQKLIAEGFSEDYCHDAADTALSDHDANLQSLKDERTRIAARLSIIKPLVNLERVANTKAADKGEFQSRLLDSLERIASSLEVIAGRIGCGDAGSHKRNGRKSRATA